MKLFITSIIAFLLLAASPSYSTTVSIIPFNPVISNSLSVLVDGSTYSSVGVYYFTNPISGYFSRADTSGNIYKPAAAQWVNTADLLLPGATVQKKDISAKLPLSHSEVISRKKVSGAFVYPNLHDALHVSSPEIKPKTKDRVAGDYVTDDLGDVRQIKDSVIAYRYDGACVSIPHYYHNAYMVLYSTGTPCPGGYTYATTITFNYFPEIITPEIIPAEPGVAYGKLTAKTDLSEGTVNVQSLYEAEIEAMLHDPDYVPVFNDSTTGALYTPPSPSSVATPEQVAAYNAPVQAAADAQAAATAAAGDAITSAAGSASASQTAATTAAALAAANPGDSSLQIAAATAQAQAAGALAALDKLLADQAAVAAEKATEDATTYGQPNLGPYNEYNTDVVSPDKKDIPGLLSTLFNSSPLVSMVQSFSISTSGASGVVPIALVYGQELTFDFTRWEAILRACGGVLIIIMHGVCILVVVRGW